MPLSVDEAKPGLCRPYPGVVKEEHWGPVIPEDAHAQALDRADGLTWDRWAQVENAAVTEVGRETLTWAVDEVKMLLGQNWLADNGNASGTVPLMGPNWWPLTNPLPVACLLELAVRAHLVRISSGSQDLLADARQIHRDQFQVLRQFAHLNLSLEVAAFALTDGWEVSYECALSSGKKPDLRLSRDGLDYSIEATTLAHDRDSQKITRWSDFVQLTRFTLEAQHGVSTAVRSQEWLDDAAAAIWAGELALVCAATGADGIPRTHEYQGTTTQAYSDGQRPPGNVYEGPWLEGDLWGRVAGRLAAKIRQTAGGPPAWIRIDEVGDLFQLTDWSRKPLPQRLDDLANNIAIALQDAPHIRGVILTDGTPRTLGSVEEYTVHSAHAASRLISPLPTNETLTAGPVALQRALPGRRSRLTFAVPTTNRRIILPSGRGLEPALWYANESHWLNRALTSLGHPSLAAIFAE
jgi:hypothetical protein